MPDDRPPLTLDSLIERPGGRLWDMRVGAIFHRLRTLMKLRLEREISVREYAESRADLIYELDALVVRREHHEAASVS